MSSVRTVASIVSMLFALAGCGREGFQQGTNLCNLDFVDGVNHLTALYRDANTEAKRAALRSEAVAFKTRFAGVNCTAQVTRTVAGVSSSFESTVSAEEEANRYIEAVDKAAKDLAAYRANLKMLCCPALVADLKALIEKTDNVVSRADAVAALASARAFDTKHGATKCKVPKSGGTWLSIDAGAQAEVFIKALEKAIEAFDAGAPPKVVVPSSFT